MRETRVRKRSIQDRIDPLLQLDGCWKLESAGLCLALPVNLSSSEPPKDVPNKMPLSNIIKLSKMLLGMRSLASNLEQNK